MKILYLGLPLGALMLLREGHDLVGACISRPSMPGMRRLSSSALVNTPARAPTLPPPVSCASSPSCAAAKCTQ